MLLNIIKKVAYLAGLSLVVGFVLSLFDIRPMEVPSAVFDAAKEVFHQVESALHWAWRYIILGATIVVPVWLVAWLLRRSRGS